MKHAACTLAILASACTMAEPTPSSRGTRSPTTAAAPATLAWSPPPTTAPAPTTMPAWAPAPPPRAPTTSPAPRPPPPPPPPPPGPGAPPTMPYEPGPTHPVGAIDLPCTVRAELEPTLGGGKLRLRFVLKNLGRDAVTFTLKNTCPGGPVTLSGLPDTFDPLHRCRAGACAQPVSTTTYTIAGGKRVVLGETTLTAKGDACNPPLPRGSTFLQAQVTTAPWTYEVCSGGSVHLVRDHKTGALRLANLTEPAVPATPPTKPAPPTTKPTPTKPAVTPAPRTQCPACAVGCPSGAPLTGLGPDGCPRCGCEQRRPLLPVPPTSPPPTTKPAPAKPAPTVTPTPRKQCPACGIGCPNSRPLTGRGPDGCPRCGCEKGIDLAPPRQPPSKP